MRLNSVDMCGRLPLIDVTVRNTQPAALCHFCGEVTPSVNPQQRNSHTGYGVEDEEAVGGGIKVHHHVGAHLMPVESVSHDFYGSHHLKGTDVEHKDVERVVAAIGKKALHGARVAADECGYMVKGKEAQHTRQREGGHVPHARFERHSVKTESGTASEQGEIYQGECPMLPEAAFVAAVKHAKGKERHAPALPDATLHECGYFQSVTDFHQGKDECRSGYHTEHGIGLEPTTPSLESLVDDNKDYAHHQQRAEEPECSGKELIVSAHREHYLREPLQRDMERVGMRDASLPIAVGLIENAYLEENVVDQEEKHAPFHKRHIESLEALHAEIPR